MDRRSLFGSRVISGILSPEPLGGLNSVGERNAWNVRNISMKDEHTASARIGFEKPIWVEESVFSRIPVRRRQGKMGT